MTTPPPPGSWPPPGNGPQQGPRAGWPPPAPVAPPPRPAPIAPQGTRRMPPPGAVQPPPMPSGPHNRPPMPSGPMPSGPMPSGPMPSGPQARPPGPQGMPPAGPRPMGPGAPVGGFPPPRAVMPPPMAAPHSAPRPMGPGGPGGPPPPWMPPQQGWAMGFPPPPRKSAGPVVALVLVSALVLGVGLVAIVAGAGKRTPVAEPGYTYPSYTGTSRTTGYRTTSSTSSTYGATTGRLTTTARTTSATSSAPPQPRPVAKLADNPLHLAGRPVAPANCNLPGFKSDPGALRAFYGAAVRCMHEAWAPAMRAANLPEDPPGLEVVVGKDNSPCSSGGYSSGAFYCGRNHTIYMNARVERNDGQNVQAGPSLGVLAHEYGHHVQSMSGILGAAWDLMYDAGQTSPRGLELSRRKELQASCFAGMFLAAASGRASVNRNLANAAINDLGQRGDWPNNKRPRDHGSPGNNKAWASHGAKYNNSRDCNTWNAEGKIVS